MKKLQQILYLMTRLHRILFAKYIYRKNDVAFIEQLEKLRPALLKEFLDNHPDFTNIPVSDRAEVFYIAGDTWKTVTFKYMHEYVSNKEELQQKYPTVIKLLDTLDVVPITNYSLLHPGGEIKLHIDPENSNSEYLRYHVPLIVPSEDPNKVGFEVMGEKIDWNEVFAFDDQGLHTAWNKTDNYRLVFLIDIHRGDAGLKATNIPHIENKQIEIQFMKIARLLRKVYFTFKEKLS